MKFELVASVGKGFPSEPYDVIKAQKVLNKIYASGGNAYGETLPENGFLCSKTQEVILGFQLLWLIGDREIDERVMRPGGKTEGKINEVLEKYCSTRDADLAHLLLLSDMSKGTPDQQTIADRQRLRTFLMRSLRGENVDVRYWEFVYIDKFDTECLPERDSYMYAVRRKSEYSATEQFRAKMKGAETVERAQTVFFEFEKYFSANVRLLKRFFMLHDGTADARASSHENEVRYINEMAERARKTVHPSIYSLYSHEILPVAEKFG